MSMEIITRYMASNKYFAHIYGTRKEAEVQYRKLKGEGCASLSKITKVIATDVVELK